MRKGIFEPTSPGRFSGPKKPDRLRDKLYLQPKDINLQPEYMHLQPEHTYLQAGDKLFTEKPPLFHASSSDFRTTKQ